MSEEWKQIKDFPNYYISNMGNVKSNTKFNKVLKQYKTIGNYLSVTLYNNGIAKKKVVHRLVATHFIDNPNNLPEVNHIDGNKHNNKADNLEWCTSKYNQIHAIKNNLYKHYERKVNQYDLNGNYIKTWNSMTQAEKELKLCPRSICSCCNGRAKSSGGYRWEYFR